MVRATVNGKVIAETDDVVVVDGYVYFPRNSVRAEVLADSDHTSVCPWKGRARYYDVVVDGVRHPAAAWYYPNPSPLARKIRGRIAFWGPVEVAETDEDDGINSDAPDAEGDRTDETGIRGLFRRLLQPRPAEHAAGDANEDPTSAAVADLDDSTFENGTLGQWTVVDFWAPWCGPCRSLHPIFEDVARATENVRFARVNVDENPRTAGLLGVMSIPTVILFDPRGSEVARLVGVPPRRELDRLLSIAAGTQADPRRGRR